VQGRGKAAPARARELHMGFMFLGEKGKPRETTPCLVVKEGNSKMCMAMMVPTESVDQFVVKRVKQNQELNPWPRSDA
jgi:hypothetical protein